MESKSRVVYVAVEVGKYLLKNGAEVSRVEDTMLRILKSKGHHSSDVFAIPTGIVLSSKSDGEVLTLLERIHSSSIDLEAIDRANTFSRRYIAGEIDFENVESELDMLKDGKKYSVFIRLLGGCVGGGFWTVLFGGNLIELILAFIGSGLNVWAFELLSNNKFNFFIKHILGGFIAGILGIALVKVVGLMGYRADLALVIVGPLMTLVPGVQITNGMRDIISGELITGSATITQAIFTAIAIAFGIGVVLKIGVNYI